MGMEIITDNLEAIDHRPAACLFQGVDRNNLIKTIGQVNLLVRIQIVEIHPIVVERKHIAKNLHLLSS